MWSRDSISIYILLLSCKISEITASYEVSILNSKREETNKMRMKFSLRFVPGMDRGFRKLVSRSFLLEKANDLLPNGRLTIVCKVWDLRYGARIVEESDEIYLFQVPESTLSDDLSILFNNCTYYDVTLSVSGHEFQAHRAILAARSPVFANIFEGEMEEQKVICLEIADIHHKVFREVLDFIYTGKAAKLKKMTKNLLAAADMYALPRLKAMCEEALRLNLSIENAADTLILADLHSAEQLKIEAIDFINTHATDVTGTTGWKSMIMSHPHLIAEAFRTLATQMYIPVPRKRVKESQRQCDASGASNSSSGSEEEVLWVRAGTQIPF